MVETYKACPFCGEQVLAVAKKCKHCREWLAEEHPARHGASSQALSSVEASWMESMPAATQVLGDGEVPNWAPPTLISSVRRFALGSMPSCLVFAALSTGILYRNGGMRLTEAINRFPLRVVLMLALFFLGSALTASVAGGSAIHVACGMMSKSDASGRRPKVNVWLAVAVGTAAIGGLLGFLACIWTEWVFQSVYLKDSAPYYGLSLFAAAAGSYLSARHYNEPEA